MRKVQQELEVARTISRIKRSHDDNDINFIGVYITSDDKASLILSITDISFAFSSNFLQTPTAIARILSASNEFLREKLHQEEFIYGCV